jgi:hypothetical protein
VYEEIIPKGVKRANDVARFRCGAQKCGRDPSPAVAGSG